MYKISSSLWICFLLTQGLSQNLLPQGNRIQPNTPIPAVQEEITSIRTELRALQLKVSRLTNTLYTLTNSMSSTLTSVNTMASGNNGRLAKIESENMSEDCSGKNMSGPFDILIEGQKVTVFCENDGNDDWITILKRQDGSVDFDKLWQDYKKGFGNIEGEHYLGHEYIHKLTKRGYWRLRVDIEDFIGDTGVADHDEFYMLSEDSNYKFSFTNSSGAFLALTLHIGHDFTTRFRHNDRFDTNKVNCARGYRAPWWYVNCYNLLLTGPYANASYTGGDAMRIHHWKGAAGVNLKRATMKIRKLN